MDTYLKEKEREGKLTVIFKLPWGTYNFKLPNAWNGLPQVQSETAACAWSTSIVLTQNRAAQVKKPLYYSQIERHIKEYVKDNLLGRYTQDRLNFNWPAQPMTRLTVEQVMQGQEPTALEVREPVTEEWAPRARAPQLLPPTAYSAPCSSDRSADGVSWGRYGTFSRAPSLGFAARVNPR